MKKFDHLSIVYLDRDGLPARIKVPAPQVSHDWQNYDRTAPEEVIARSQNADVLVVNKVAIDATTLSACPRLKHIVVSATGYNIIDTNACKHHGVTVSHVPSYAATTVSEHVIGTAIALRREILRYSESVADGQWQTASAFCLFGKPFQNLAGSTLGLVGMGEIAQATAKKASALGMRVLFCSRQRKTHDIAEQVSFEELISSVDVVSLHCSLNPSSENLISSAEFAMMRPNAILINTARGGIVDEAAAVEAIRQKKIAGLAFDVLCEEPPQDDSPLLSIANEPNVIITPHIAWASEQAMQHLANVVSKNIDAFAHGQPVNIVSG